MLSKYFLPYINTEGGSFKPYSMMLVKNLKTNVSSTKLKKTSYINCWRCLGLNMDDWLEIEDEEEAKTVGLDFLRILVESRLDRNSPELADFFEVSEYYYDEDYISDYFPDWEYDQDEELVWNVGFLKYYPDSWDEPAYDEFPTKKKDLGLYMDALFGEAETDFLDKWGDYPLIIQKYYLLKECVENLGVDFNAVKL